MAQKHGTKIYETIRTKKEVISQIEKDIQDLKNRLISMNQMLEKEKYALETLESVIQHDTIKSEPKLENTPEIPKNNEYLYDSVFEFIKTKGKARSSDIAEKFGQGNRREELRVHNMIRRLEFANKIKRVPEFLEGGIERRKNLLYEIIT